MQIKSKEHAAAGSILFSGPWLRQDRRSRRSAGALTDVSSHNRAWRGVGGWVRSFWTDSAERPANKIKGKRRSVFYPVKSSSPVYIHRGAPLISHGFPAHMIVTNRANYPYFLRFSLRESMMSLPNPNNCRIKPIAFRKVLKSTAFPPSVKNRYNAP